MSIISGGEATTVTEPNVAESTTVEPTGGEQTVTEPNVTEQATDGNWYDSLDSSLHEKVSKFNTNEDLAKSYVELEKKLGERPNVPETANDYKYDFKNVEMDADVLNGLKENFHKMNITDEQFQGIMDTYDKGFELQQQQQEQMQVEERQSTIQALEQDWGEKFSEKLQETQNTIKKFGMEDSLNDLGLGDNYNVIKMFDELTARISEDSSPENQGVPITINEQIMKTRDLLEKTPAWDGNHEKLQQRLEDLYKRKFPN